MANLKYNSSRSSHLNQASVIIFLSISACLSFLQPALAAGSESSQTSASSTQPLWSYQVKPGSSNYVNGPSAQASGHSNSIFDAFNGLSQRQGALSNSPFLSILPIILIAAGGMLLLLPFLTMMIASPFSGGLPGYGQGGFGYPQLNAGLSKKRSLGAEFPRGLNDILDQVSSTIDELARRYSNTNGGKRSSQGSSLGSSASGHQLPAGEQLLQAANLLQAQVNKPVSPASSGNDDFGNINNIGKINQPSSIAS